MEKPHDAAYCLEKILYSPLTILANFMSLGERREFVWDRILVGTPSPLPSLLNDLGKWSLEVWVISPFGA